MLKEPEIQTLWANAMREAGKLQLSLLRAVNQNASSEIITRIQKQIIYQTAVASTYSKVLEEKPDHSQLTVFRKELTKLINAEYSRTNPK